MLAAVYDLSYDTSGYTLVFLNNIFTTMNGVWMKKASLSGKCSKMGVLFYNSLFSAIFMCSYFFLEHLLVSYDLESSMDVTRLFAASSSSSTAAIAESTTRSLAEVITNNLRSVATAVALPDVGAAGALVAAEVIARGANNNLSLLQSVIEHTPAPQAVLAAIRESTLLSVWKFEQLSDWRFLFMFVLAASMGSVLNYSIFVCTTVNSALTTAVVGALKNVATTYIGMMVFADYNFSWVNFFGINISIAGSLYYTYITIFKGATGFGGG